MHLLTIHAGNRLGDESEPSTQVPAASSSSHADDARQTVRIALSCALEA